VTAMARSLDRPRVRPQPRGPDPVSVARRRLVVVAAALAGAGVMLLAGLWGFHTDRSGDQHAAAAPAGWVTVPGGWMTVRDVANRAVNHKGMPGMQTMPDPDPVPAGYVRLTVDLSLAARGGTLRWQPSDFTVQGKGLGTVRPHAAHLGDGVVPSGTQVAGDLTFQVPKKARQLTLDFRGDGSVPLELPSSHHGSGAHSH
jgi:hypothetical protein